ncbi:hypothetical protein GCM10027262_61410 [Nocardia tengchongensis]
MAFGLPYDFESVTGRGRGRERTFAWSEAFTDSATDLRLADFFYRGSPVDRVVYVSVDGGRASLPWALEYDGLKADLYDTAVARLVNTLGGRWRTSTPTSSGPASSSSSASRPIATARPGTAFGSQPCAARPGRGGSSSAPPDHSPVARRNLLTANRFRRRLAFPGN